jgi:Asp-tRNA(Asn)/Glu-tRNA(Gln) amidotransferase C subunit
MKEAMQRLNVEYGLGLTEDEIDQIAKQAVASEKLFAKLFEVDVEGIAPALKIDPAEKE